MPFAGLKKVISRRAVIFCIAADCNRDVHRPIQGVDFTASGISRAPAWRPFQRSPCRPLFTLSASYLQVYIHIYVYIHRLLLSTHMCVHSTSNQVYISLARAGRSSEFQYRFLQCFPAIFYLLEINFEFLSCLRTVLSELGRSLKFCFY